MAAKKVSEGGRRGEGVGLAPLNSGRHTRPPSAPARAHARQAAQLGAGGIGQLQEVDLPQGGETRGSAWGWVRRGRGSGCEAAQAGGCPRSLLMRRTWM